MAWLAKKYNAAYVDLGGGMYGPMPNELSAQFSGYEGSYEAYAEVICNAMKEEFPDESCKLILEPGTALVGNTMDMMATVISVRKIRGKVFITLDCNSNQMGVITDMKELPVKVYETEKSLARLNVEDAIMTGNTCLEFDYIRRGWSGSIAVGDKVLFQNVGAYSISSARQFIAPVPAVIDAKTGDVIMVGEDFASMFAKYYREE